MESSSNSDSTDSEPNADSTSPILTRQLTRDYEVIAEKKEQKELRKYMERMNYQSDSEPEPEPEPRPEPYPEYQPPPEFDINIIPDPPKLVRETYEFLPWSHKTKESWLNYVRTHGNNGIVKTPIGEFNANSWEFPDK